MIRYNILKFSNSIKNRNKHVSFQSLNNLRYNSSNSSTSKPLLYNMNTVGSQLKGPSKRIGLAFILSATVTGLGLMGWFFTHMYIEKYLHSTSDRLSWEVRSYLRGAYLREEVQLEPSMVEMYLMKAREKIILDKEVPLDSTELLEIHQRLANNLKLRKRFKDALEFLELNWAVLYPEFTKRNLKDCDIKRLSMFLDLGLELGKISISLKEYDLGLDYLSKGFEYLFNSQDHLKKLLESKDQQAKIDKIKLDKYSVDYRTLLASIYAFKKDFKTSLKLYLDTLKTVQSYSPQSIKRESQDKESKLTIHPFGAIESLLLGYITEVNYASTHDLDSSLDYGWSAYQKAKPFADTIDGELAAANALRTLAALYEKKNNKEQQVACLSQGLLAAEKALNYDLAVDIAGKLEEARSSSNL